MVFLIFAILLCDVATIVLISRFTTCFTVTFAVFLALSKFCLSVQH